MLAPSYGRHTSSSPNPVWRRSGNGRELEATSKRARKCTVDAFGDLTPQEAWISRLAARGLTNKEIAAQLLISASTLLARRISS
jgi:DNA-binding NarL/FixJ family response regulator